MSALLTVSDFQRKFRVSRSTVYRLRAKGLIRFIHIGRSVRIHNDDAEKLIADLAD